MAPWCTCSVEPHQSCCQLPVTARYQLLPVGASHMNVICNLIQFLASWLSQAQTWNLSCRPSCQSRRRHPNLAALPQSKQGSHLRGLGSYGAEMESWVYLCASGMVGAPSLILLVFDFAAACMWQGMLVLGRKSWNSYLPAVIDVGVQHPAGREGGMK